MGHRVFLRLQPYKKISLKVLSSMKLRSILWPYRVLECIGPIAYRLDLPASTKTHPVSSFLFKKNW